MPIQRIDPTLEPKQVERLCALRAKRNAGPVWQAAVRAVERHGSVGRDSDAAHASGRPEQMPQSGEILPMPCTKVAGGVSGSGGDLTRAGLWGADCPLFAAASGRRFVFAGCTDGVAVQQTIAAQAHVELGLAQHAEFLAPATRFRPFALSADGSPLITGFEDILKLRAAHLGQERNGSNARQVPGLNVSGLRKRTSSALTTGYFAGFLSTHT